MYRIAICLACAAVFGLLTFAFLARNKGVLARKRNVWLLIPGTQAAAVFIVLRYGFVSDASVRYFVLLLLMTCACGVVDALSLFAQGLFSRGELSEEKAAYLESQLKLQRLYNRRYKKNLEEAREVRRSVVGIFSRVGQAIQDSSGLDAELARVNLTAKTVCRDKICDNPVVDAVLKLKLDECESKGIQTAWRVVVPSDLRLSSVDLCAVFSNLMDNAINACAELESERRFIDIRARVTAGRLAVEVVNTCGEDVLAKPKYSTGFLAMPSDVPEHGWGFAILRSISLSNDGSFETSVETREGLGRVFRATIILGLGGGGRRNRYS